MGHDRLVRLLCVAARAACAVVHASGPRPAADAVPGPRATLKAGDKTPQLGAVSADGNALTADARAGKTVVVAFGELDAGGSGMPLGTLCEVRRAAGDGALILTACVNGSRANWDAWSKVLPDQGTVDYGDGERRFIDDPRWWNVTEVSAARRASARAYGVTAYPDYFVLKADGTVGGAHVPPARPKATIETVPKRQEARGLARSAGVTPPAATAG